MKGNSISLRVDPALKKLFEDVSIERLKVGRDRKQLTPRRLSLAMTRIPTLKEVLIRSDIK